MNKSRDTHRKRICILATTPFAIEVFMRTHINALKKDYDVTLVTSDHGEKLIELIGDNISFISIQIDRKISIENDILALIKLWRLFREEKFDSVHSIMPKSGLLAMLAARFAGVPSRLHTFTGQVWANQKGFRRFALRILDKVLAMSATKVLADSHSQRLFLIENNVVNATKILVLAGGSIAGVNLNRFKYDAEMHNQIRLHKRIQINDIVFLFLGRLTLDKGLMDLSRAFARAAKQDANIHLLVVGPDEENLEMEFSILAQRFPGRVHRVGFTDCPENYMAAADVFCLPSYREGFGSVIIEAAAVGLPAIASRIYGVTDAIEDGVTGILHTPTSDHEIAEAMLLLASDEALRYRMGKAARTRVANEFSEARVTEAFVDFYREMFSMIRIKPK